MDGTFLYQFVPFLNTENHITKMIKIKFHFAYIN